MPYKTGVWGIQAKERNIRRRKYFRERWRKLKNVKSTLGFDAEQEALKLLEVKEKQWIRSKGDILWRGKYIDVKTDVFSNYHGTWGWIFNCRRQKGKADYFMCFAKDKNKKTQYIFMIPDKSFSTKNIWISPKNIDKYMKYIFKKAG